MRKTYHHTITSLLVLFLVGLSSIWMIPRMASNSLTSPCDDPIQNCKKPVYVGSNRDGRCSCFTCEDGSFACTDKPKDKLQLFEAEALHRETEGLIRALPQAQKNRLKELGIGPDDFGTNANANRAVNLNLNDNRAQINRNKNENRQLPGADRDVNQIKTPNVNASRSQNRNAKVSPSPKP